MSLADRLDQRPIGASQIRILALMVVLLMVEGLDLQLLGLLAPVILKQWAVERAAFGPAMAAALIGLALGAGIGGPLGDRFGRKRVLMVSAIIFAFGTSAAALAHNIPQLTIIRLISGMGFGAASPVSIALVAEWLPRRIQPTAVAIMTVGTPFGGMVGSAALIPLAPLLGWQGCFIACGLLTMVLTLLVFLFMPDSPAHLAAKGRTAEALALLRRHVDPDFAEADIASAPTEQRVAAQASPDQKPLGPAYRRLTLGSWLLFFSAQFIAYSIISWGTTMLDLAHFSRVQALQGTSSFNLCAVVATLAAGPLIQWFGSRAIVIFGSSMTLLSLLALFSTLGTVSGPPTETAYWVVILAIAGIGTFISITMAAGYALITMGYPEQARSTGIGIALMIGRMGGVVTALFGGLLLSLAGDAVQPFLIALIALIFVAFAGGLIINRHIAARAG